MATKKTFEVGDIVKLKSGGPDMTVHSVPSGDGNHYDCKWFAGKKLERGTFQGETLIAVAAPAP